MPTLIVNNFVHIREAELDMDKKLVVLIGEQASGKSTLARLLYFFRDTTRIIRKWLWMVNWEGEQTLGAALHHHLTRQFRLFFGEPTRLGPFKITYRYTEESAVTLALTDDGQVDITLPAIMDEVNALYENYQEDLRKSMGQYVKTGEASSTTFAAGERVLQEIYFGSEIDRVSEGLFGTYFSSFYLPADRQVATNYPDAFKRVFYGGIKRDIFECDVADNPVPAAQIYILSQFLEKNEEFLRPSTGYDYQALLDIEANDEDYPIDAAPTEFLMEKMARILKGTYGTADDKKSLFKQPTGEGSVPLLVASAGEQNVLRLLQDIFNAVLYREENMFRVIEEPEASLYPTAQKELIESIALMLNMNESQVVLTTHSPYVLTVLQTLLRAKRTTQKHSTAADKIEALAPSRCWLATEDVAVYELKDGACHSLIDAESEEILPNPLAALLTQFSLDISE